jgi:hypothetical protein
MMPGLLIQTRILPGLKTSDAAEGGVMIFN